MTDLPDLLERTAAKTPVGPPPLDALHAGAARRKRRTARWSMAAAATVATVVVGSTLLISHRPSAPVTSPSVPLRMVGMGHVAIPVPATWGTNQSRCGTPIRDTVQINDPSEAVYCLAFRPAGVDSVTLGQGGPEPARSSDEDITIGGLPAVRRQTTCADAGRGVRVCSGEVRFRDFWFRAESSTDAAEVDRLLSRIVVLPDRVGVPAYPLVPETTAGLSYTELLQRLGLKVTVRRAKSGNHPPGQILRTWPEPGTMVAPGTTVTVTVAK